MQKLSLILALILFFSGCSVVRKQGRTIENTDNLPINELAEIKKLNITEHNFVIQKAAINIMNNGEEKKLLGTLKYGISGTYLCSIKSPAGIEAARVMITDDTVLINDRINRKLFYGSPESLAGKYGISFLMLPLILGDYIDFQPQNGGTLVCKSGIGKIELKANEKKISYEIDCSKGKVTKAIITDDVEKEGLRISMSRFANFEGLTCPAVIVLEDLGKETVITLRIEKIKIIEEENIDFIPGNNYEKVLLK